MKSGAAIVPFDFEGNNVRIVNRDGEAWFVLADVCRVLEIANVGNASARLKEHEQNSIRLTDVIRRGNPNVTIINEPGFYRLVLRSDKPAAERFQDWVVTEVLPSIRKTGSYSARQAEEPRRRELVLADEVLALKRLMLSTTDYAVGLENRIMDLERKAWQMPVDGWTRDWFEARMAAAGIKSYTELAERVCVSKSMLSFMLDGKRSTALPVARGLARELGVPLIEIARRTTGPAMEALLEAGALCAEKGHRAGSAV
ncbi:prophage antirepressor [Rhodomicrobium vannielii ATCC 17100]|uniref:Prophage antirepressor n=1 Tax=Rhodomicrobium vannielii (strain ATCC 17100 / DSM 162 / LMG 4299 / NCIMB 10020 / ATH 3.1.1) TaxID=648757 RepID=E3I797_RHOVT|nr:BRO family protein [Rhodomicrobium vannielii]ADP70748.1 prophage antirepressor [Rhodomicrobium vannielii ATCC 17100]